MKMMMKSSLCRAGEIVFLLLVGFYFTAGFPLIPDAWNNFFDMHPKVHRKLLSLVAGGAVILGLLLIEWARRDKDVRSQSLLSRMVETWKTASAFWITGSFFIFGSWWTASSCLRYCAMNSGFDMAIFTQAIWNTTQGDWFYSSIKGGISLLGDHFAPLIAIFAVPYKFFPDPKVLLAIQAFSAATCVYPLARIVRKSGQSSAWAVLYCLLFVIYLPVRNSVRFEFHPEVVAMPFLFWAFTFLKEKKTFLASVFLATSLLAKENMATIAFVFGLYACIKKDRSWGFGIFWIIISTFYFYLVILWLIPKLSGAPYFYLDGNFMEWRHAGWTQFLKHIFQPSTFSYLAKIYAPLAFTSLLAPASFILTLPTLAQNLFSRNEMTRSIFFQYTTTLTPFVFISSAMALARIRSHRRFWAYLLLLASVLMSGVSEIYPMRRSWLGITQRARYVAGILRSIPPEYSVRTHERYATHVANRRELYIYENNHPKEGGSQKALQADIVIIDREFLNASYDSSLATLLRTGYRLVLSKDGFVILEHEAPDQGRNLAIELSRRSAP